MLMVSVLEENLDVQGGLLAPTESGWLSYDANAREVVEFDATLRELRRWGSIEDPVGLMTMSTIGPALIDNSIPGFRVLDEATIYPVMGVASDAVAADGRRIVYGTSGGVFELSLQEPRSDQRRLFDLEDFGMPVHPANGLAPRFRLRTGQLGGLYVAWVTQSSIWALREGENPTRLVQRCVPEPLLHTHRSAPTITVGTMTGLKAAVSSIQDYIVLRTGEILVLGALSVGDDDHRSIELYGRDGALIQAWELPIRHAVGRFDPRDPAKLLLYRARARGEGLKLVRLRGEGYPR